MEKTNTALWPAIERKLNIAPDFRALVFLRRIFDISTWVTAFLIHVVEEGEVECTARIADRLSALLLTWLWWAGGAREAGTELGSGINRSSSSSSSPLHTNAYNCLWIRWRWLQRSHLATTTTAAPHVCARVRADVSVRVKKSIARWRTNIFHPT